MGMGIKTAAVRGMRRAARPLLTAWTANGRLTFHRTDAKPRPVALYSVYRYRNAGHLARMIETAADGSQFAFHALDEVSPLLAEFTVSVGSGARVPLLTSLMTSHPPMSGIDVVIADDDVDMVADSLSRFAGLAHAAALDIAQPAHARGSICSYLSNRVSPPSTARLVRFIESGPIVLFSPETFRRLFPLPSEVQMGWGVDVWWSALQDPPLCLGIVDATPMMHRGAVGVEYPNEDEQRILETFLTRAGLSSSHELDANIGPVWRPWQRLPKWAV